MDQPKNKGMDRRTFMKTSGMIGLGVAASSFGVPKLLRAAPPTIKIGSVQPATGPLAVIGVGQRRGNQLAVDYINAQGGIKSMAVPSSNCFWEIARVNPKWAVRKPIG